MLRAGYSTETLAEAAGVTGKSVQRWLGGEVTPFPRTRFKVAALVGEDEGYLWPQAVNRAALAGAELAATWPRRTDVPGHLWTDLLRAAKRNVDVLAFAGLFLTEEHSGWLPALADKAGTDCRVRLLLHDTPLYNSIYRFDDEMLINVHAYGILAAYTPVMHLRRVDGAFFHTYLESFERVWASASAPPCGLEGDP